MLLLPMISRTPSRDLHRRLVGPAHGEGVACASFTTYCRELQVDDVPSSVSINVP
jgi:hypothetical protein